MAFLHKNAVLMIGLTEQSYYSICHLLVRLLIRTVPGISWFQRITTLVHTKDILRVSTCQNVSIMTRGINTRRSVTAMSLMSDVP